MTAAPLLKRFGLPAAVVLIAIALTAPPAAAQSPITFDGPAPGLASGADVTFFYNSVADTWATTFRAKGATGQPTTTNASGLTAPFNAASTPGTWIGILGNVTAIPAGNAGDYTFTTLTTNVLTTQQVQVGATNYFVASASGSTINPSTPTADLGIRTRLRENQVAMGIGSGTAANQFDSFNLTLDPAASTFNGSPLNTSGAFVSLLNYTGTNSEALIDSATGQLTANFPNYEHVHRNWGFSQYGEYSLAFQLQGVGGTYGPTAAVGTTTVNFVTAVPEPGTVVLSALGLLGAAGGFRWLRRRTERGAATLAERPDA